MFQRSGILPETVLGVGREDCSVGSVRGFLQACHFRVARTQRLEMVTVADRLEDRRRLIERMIHFGIVELSSRSTAPGYGCVAAGPTTVRWRHVIPRAAQLVISDDDERVLAVPTTVDRLHLLYQVEFTPIHSGIARMLVLLTHGLDEADNLERAALAARMNSTSWRR